MCDWIIEHGIELAALVVSSFAAWVTYRVAHSADTTAKQTLEISERMERMEKRTEGPVITLVSQDISRPMFFTWEQDSIRGFLVNQGNGAALNIRGVINGQDFHFGDSESLTIGPNSLFPKVPYEPDTSGMNNGLVRNNALRFFNGHQCPRHISTPDKPYGEVILTLKYDSVLGNKVTSVITFKDNGAQLSITNQKIDVE